ncbi:MAG: class I SAM-dependent methyltransferase [Planctomycetes bacterium]|nr:class I SAM-dependent methyltransferase [Planctomycetota bacterium]MBL7189510.1 class I SAM-dependent methyltransferase [Phycisphaerae bacterium]
MRRVLVAAVLCMSACTLRAQDDFAKEILGATGVSGGLIVHLDCGDGKLTAALRANDKYLVHGLDMDPEQVAEAHEHVCSLGLYGRVSVDTFDGRRLPYVDNLVNLIVADQLGGVTMEEVMRVLAPLGVAYVRRNGKWQETVKQRPEGVDEWTHYLYNASGNAVSRDRQVGPTRYLKWVADPLWSRSHEYTPSLAAMVSAGGRIFSIHDDGVRGVTDQRIGDVES